MNFDPELVAEAKEQLQDDLLAFSWLVQMARQLGPESYGTTKRSETVIDCVVHLHGQGTVVVGNAVLRSDLCRDRTPDRNPEHALRARLDSVTAAWRGPQHAMQLKTAEAEKLQVLFLDSINRAL